GGPGGRGALPWTRRRRGPPPPPSANEKEAPQRTKYPLPGRKSAGRRVFCCSDVESCPSWRVGGPFGREKAPNVGVRGRCGRARPGFGSGSGGGLGGWWVRAGVAVCVRDGSSPARLSCGVAAVEVRFLLLVPFEGVEESEVRCRRPERHHDRSLGEAH